MIERSLHHCDHLMNIELQGNFLSSIDGGTTITLNLRARFRVFFGTCTCQLVALIHGVSAGSDGDTVSKQNLDPLNLSLLHFSSAKFAGRNFRLQRSGHMLLVVTVRG
jgi:hypothetical protein